MSAILQSRLPAIPWLDPRLSRLPGTLPLDPADWLIVDEAYGGQMALRDRLIAQSPDLVHALLPAARPAAEELLDLVLSELPRLGFDVGALAATRPDGESVLFDLKNPLLTLGRLTQEDFCILQPGGQGEDGQRENGQGENGQGEEGQGEHVLTGAILCFPSSWTLAEKIGHPLVRIHTPVPEYDADIAPRVQRLFDAIRPGRPMWRMNANPYVTPDLFHPLPEARPRPRPSGSAPYLRSERQTLLRLPRTGAVVFGIHTYMLAMDSLPAEARAALPGQTGSGP